MNELTISTINSILFDTAIPFDLKHGLSLSQIKDKQELLFRSFRDGIIASKVFLDEIVYRKMCKNEKFEKIRINTDFDYVINTLMKRKADFELKCKDDYWLIRKYNRDLSSLTDWEKLFVESTRYSRIFYHQILQHNKGKKQKKRIVDTDSTLENLKKPRKFVTLYVPENPNTSFLGFYSERNPKEVLRIKKKFLKNMTLALWMCNYDENKFIDKLDYYHDIILPRDYFGVRVVLNIYPMGFIPGISSNKLKKSEKKKQEKIYYNKNLKKAVKCLSWDYADRITDERTGYSKYWLSNDSYTKETIALQITDPITLWMKDYFDKEKHELYENKNKLSAWQEGALAKIVGLEKAKKFEEECIEDPIYKIMDERLTPLLTSELEDSLVQLKKEVFG